MDVGDNVAGDVVTGLCISFDLKKVEQGKWISSRWIFEMKSFLWKSHTELYGLLEWSCSWSSGVCNGDGKCTDVKSGNEPVLFPIGICTVLSCADGYMLID